VAAPNDDVLRIPLPDGATLAVDLLQRRGDALLLLLPGFWRSRLSTRLRDLGRRLSSLSSVAVADLRGHGDSTGRYTFGHREPSDIGLLLTYLRERGYSRIGLLGLSMGGYIAMEAVRGHWPAGVRLLGAALVSAPTQLWRARPWFISGHVLRQLQKREVRRVPRFDLRYLFRRQTNGAAARPAGEAFPVEVFHCRRDWLIPDTEAMAWIDGLGERAQLTVVEDSRRLHADAMLGGDVRLEERLEAWWRGTVAAG
jgi:pimeloyl-ACP methyl ester carboxylesterase